MLLSPIQKTRSVLLGGANVHLLFKLTNIFNFFFSTLVRVSLSFLSKRVQRYKVFLDEKNFSRKKSLSLYLRQRIKVSFFFKLFFKQLLIKLLHFMKTLQGY